MNSKNIKRLLFVAGTALSLSIFAVNFTACSSHILDIQEGLQSTSTPTQPASTPETTPPPEPTPTPTPAPTPTAHSITVTSGEHGTISVDKTNAAAGETITITVTPEAGYMLDTFNIQDSSGNEISSSGKKIKTFIMPAKEVIIRGTFRVLKTITMKPSSEIYPIFKDEMEGFSLYYIYDEYKKHVVCSTTAPSDGAETFTLSADTSEVAVYVWREENNIFYYAEDYTDSGNKIPLTTCTDMFRECYSFQSIDMSGFDTSNVTDMTNLFYACLALEEVNLSEFSTENVIKMTNMFAKCKSLREINLSNFNTEKVERMHGMFNGCSSLTELNLSNFKTEKVWDMEKMFEGCSKLTELDLSSLNAKSVWRMKDMFKDCSLLQKIIVSSNFLNFKLSHGKQEYKDMFLGCNSLIGGAGTLYDDSITDMTYARIDGENSLPGYFTRKQ